MLVAYGHDSKQINLEDLLKKDYGESERTKRSVETNMVDSDDIKDYPCHL